MNRVLLTASIIIATTALAATGGVLVASAPSDHMNPDIDAQREATEGQILTRAREHLGKSIEQMQPAWLINYIIAPHKDIRRHEIRHHAGMPDNEDGLFVVDKKGKHIGVWVAAKETIIHASPVAKKVIEEPVKSAMRQFPNGMRRIGPQGRKNPGTSDKAGYDFVQGDELREQLKGMKQMNGDL